MEAASAAAEGPATQSTKELWDDVRVQVEKRAVKWDDAVAALSAARKSFGTPSARTFIETYLERILHVILAQNSNEIGAKEIACADACLLLSGAIAIQDLAEAAHQPPLEKPVALSALARLFDVSSEYYRTSNLPLAPWKKVVASFMATGGFNVLARYLWRAQDKLEQHFSFGFCLSLLQAAHEAVEADSRKSSKDRHTGTFQDDATGILRSLMNFLVSVPPEYFLDTRNGAALCNFLHVLLELVCCLPNYQEGLFAFHDFWWRLIVILINSPSFEVKAVGWAALTHLVVESTQLRHRAEAIIVTGAGTSFVNGRFEFAGSGSRDLTDGDARYQLRVPDNAEEGGGKLLTLFQCVMRSQIKWWFISEADEEQPGTDRDVDYYCYKNSANALLKLPPQSGWMTKENGADPPPSLVTVGQNLSTAEVHGTLEYKLVTWAFSNGIVEFLLNDSQDEELAGAVVPMKRFLASMCRPQTVEMLLSRFPMCSSMVSARGMLPIHELIRSHEAMTNVLKAHEELLIFMGKEMRLPFLPHDWDGAVKTLLRSFPAALEYADGGDHLFPFMLAATVQTVPLDMIYFLLRENPAMVQQQ